MGESCEGRDTAAHSPHLLAPSRERQQQARCNSALPRMASQQIFKCTGYKAELNKQPKPTCEVAHDVPLNIAINLPGSCPVWGTHSSFPTGDST